MKVIGPNRSEQKIEIEAERGERIVIKSPRDEYMIILITEIGNFIITV